MGGECNYLGFFFFLSSFSFLLSLLPYDGGDSIAWYLFFCYGGRFLLFLVELLGCGWIG